jgi:ferredoxin, 2Fe-2S
MITVCFRDSSNALCKVAAKPGTTLLEAALSAGVKGIIGDCGGELSCGTCHVYVAEEFFGKLPNAADDECIMISDGVIEPLPNSRLCCQIVLDERLDGLTVTVANNG